MNDIGTVTREKLVTDFRVVIADAEELLRLTANQAGDKVADLRLRVQDHLAAARAKLAETEAAIVDQTKAVARATDDYVHDNPWRSMGIAAGIGFLVGLLIGRR
ncbi:MAG: YqjD family protein [Rhodocyclaceae bacterium]